MSDKPYFVILNHPNGGNVPMTDEDDEMVFFECEDDAFNAASNTSIGPEFGFEIFRSGNGIEY